MQIEAGKKYRSRNGEKWTNPRPYGAGDTHGAKLYGAKWLLKDENGSSFPFRDDGTFAISNPTGQCDLVAEWQDEPTGPVRTVTRQEIVPGVYGKVNVLGRSGIIGRENNVELCMNGFHDADELRSTAMILSQLAEALDDNKETGK